MTLQFTHLHSEDWRTVMDLTADNRDEVIRAAGNLAGILGPRTQWAILHTDGQRELLAFEARHARRH